MRLNSTRSADCGSQMSGSSSSNRRDAIAAQRAADKQVDEVGVGAVVFGKTRLAKLGDVRIQPPLPASLSL